MEENINCELGSVPCLICGVDNTVVKQEVEVEVEDGAGATGNCNLNGEGEEPDNSSFNFGGIGGKEDGGKWSEEEKSSYQLFFNWFRLGSVLTKKEKGNRRVNVGWDGDLKGEEPFPFCGVCREELRGLVEVQRRVEELERRILNGVEELKRKANENEERFGGSGGIYEKDGSGRYLKVRKQIVTDFQIRYPPQKKAKSSETIRKSVRIQPPEAQRYDLSELYGGSFAPDPKALPLSTTDSPNDDIKPVPETNEDTSGAHHQNGKDLSISMEEISRTGGGIPNGGEPEMEGTTVRRSSRTKRTRRIRLSPSPEKLPENQEVAPVQEPEKLSQVVDDPSIFYFGDDNDNSDILEDAMDIPMDDISPPSPYSPPKPSIKPKKKRKVVVIDEESVENPPSPPPPKTYKRKYPEDEDWQLEEDLTEALDDPDADPASEDDDASSSDGNFDLEDEITGKRSMIKHDPKKRTITLKNLIFNQIEPFADNLYQCSECFEVLKHKYSSNAIRAHYLKKHSDQFLCKMCDFRGSSKTSLKKHVAHVHKGFKRAYKFKLCPICEKPCRHPHLKTHLWSHKNLQEREDAIKSQSSEVPYTQLRSYQCDLCGQKYACPSYLERHKETVHAPKEVKESKMELCSICGGTYMDVKKHMENKHGGPKKPRQKVWTCFEDNCRKTFPIHALLKKHKDAVHRKIRPFKCSYCPRTFTVERVMKNHEGLHQGIRPFKCDHCEMAFGGKSNLVRHVKTYHSGGPVPKRKPYIRGATLLPTDVKKKDLQNEGKYLPPSALASWAAGRESTSHFVTDGAEDANRFLPKLSKN